MDASVDKNFVIKRKEKREKAAERDLIQQDQPCLYILVASQGLKIQRLTSGPLIQKVYVDWHNN